MGPRIRCFPRRSVGQYHVASLLRKLDGGKGHVLHTQHSIPSTVFQRDSANSGKKADEDGQVAISNKPLHFIFPSITSVLPNLYLVVSYLRRQRLLLLMEVPCPGLEGSGCLVVGNSSLAIPNGLRGEKTGMQVGESWMAAAGVRTEKVADNKYCLCGGVMSADDGKLRLLDEQQLEDVERGATRRSVKRGGERAKLGRTS